ncbi:MAG: hypothetical protein AB7P01_15725 [Bacteroidia bacterium]
MKSIHTLLVLSLVSLQAMAQVTSADIIMRDPSLTVKDSLNARAAHKNVKQMKGFLNEYGGETELKRVSYFSKGRLVTEYFPGSFFLRLHYSYSGDTSIVRKLMPDPSPYGGGDILQLEKYNSKGQLLLYCTENIGSADDTMKLPEQCQFYEYENGLLVTLVYGDDKERTTYDKQGNFIKVKSKVKNETYRRVYEGDKLAESYYAADKEPEKLFESLKFNADGLLAESTYYNSYSNSTYKYAYDAAKRLIVKTGDCGVVKYTYTATGHLLKEEQTGCADYPATYVTDYKYNEKGLLISIAKKASDRAEADTETFTYTYWE